MKSSERVIPLTCGGVEGQGVQGHAMDSHCNLLAQVIYVTKIAPFRFRPLRFSTSLLITVSIITTSKRFWKPWHVRLFN